VTGWRGSATWGASGGRRTPRPPSSGRPRTSPRPTGCGQGRHTLCEFSKTTPPDWGRSFRQQGLRDFFKNSLLFGKCPSFGQGRHKLYVPPKNCAPAHSLGPLFWTPVVARFFGSCRSVPLLILGCALFLARSFGGNPGGVALFLTCAQFGSYVVIGRTESTA